jgi:hypothetical protein
MTTRAVALLFVSSLFVSGTEARAALKVSKYAKVYKGDKGVRVVVAPLSPKEKRQALIQVSGIETEIDGRVFLYDLRESRRLDEYTIDVDGRKRTRLREMKQGWYRGVSLYLPDHRGEIRVWYSEKESKKVESAELLRQYLHYRPVTKRSGSLQRKMLRRQDERELAEQREKVRASCDAAIGLDVDWRSISDEHMRLVQVARHCAYALRAVREICGDSDGKKAIATKVKQLRCRFGETMKAQLSGKTLVWTVAVEGRNPSIYLKDFLLNNL